MKEEEASEGRAVVSDLSKWIMRERYRQGDWEFLLNMAQVWKFDFKRYGLHLSDPVFHKARSTAYALSILTTKESINLIKYNDQMIQSILENAPSQYALNILSQVIQATGTFKTLWLDSLIRNPQFDFSWIHRIAQTLSIPRPHKIKIMDAFQAKLVQDLSVMGISASADEIRGEIRLDVDYLAVLEALKEFPNWVQSVGSEELAERQGMLSRIGDRAGRLKDRLFERIKYILGFNVFHALGYWFLNRLAEIRGVTEDYMTPMDKFIPLVPEFVLIYYSYYIVLALPAFLVKKVRTFRLGLGAYFTAMTTIFAAFIFFPAKMIRPEIIPDGFFENLLNLYYIHDLPYNTTPSTHTTLSLLTGLILLKDSKILGRVVTGLAVLIGFSTVFVKQHFVVDVLTGWSVALMSYFLWFNWLPRWFERLKQSRYAPNFIKRLAAWMTVHEAEEYLPILGRSRHAESLINELPVRVVYDQAEKVEIVEGEIHISSRALNVEREELYKELYRKSVHALVYGDLKTLKPKEDLDAVFEKRVKALHERDLVAFDSSVFALMGGEDRVKLWFEEVKASLGEDQINYRFNDFKDSLELKNYYFVIPEAGKMGLASNAIEVLTHHLVREGHDRLGLREGDVLLDYGLLDYLITQAELETDEIAKEAYWRMAFALLLEAAHRSQTGALETLLAIRKTVMDAEAMGPVLRKRVKSVFTDLNALEDGFKSVAASMATVDLNELDQLVFVTEEAELIGIKKGQVTARIELAPDQSLALYQAGRELKDLGIDRLEIDLNVEDRSAFVSQWLKKLMLGTHFRALSDVDQKILISSGPAVVINREQGLLRITPFELISLPGSSRSTPLTCG